jgi:hypothetical protein
MIENKHNRAISQEDVEKVNQKIREINEILAPYATPLTPQERKEMLIMGDKAVSFVKKTLDYAKENKDLCPPFQDLADFEIDLLDALGLLVLRSNLNQAFEIVDDIILLAGSEAYQAALTIYNYIKFLASKGIPRAKTVYEELQKQFPGRPKSKKEGGTEEAE